MGWERLNYVLASWGPQPGEDSRASESFSIHVPSVMISVRWSIKNLHYQSTFFDLVYWGQPHDITLLADLSEGTQYLPRAPFNNEEIWDDYYIGNVRPRPGVPAEGLLEIEVEGLRSDDRRSVWDTIATVPVGNRGVGGDNRFSDNIRYDLRADHDSILWSVEAPPGNFSFALKNDGGAGQNDQRIFRRLARDSVTSGTSSENGHVYVADVEGIATPFVLNVKAHRFL